MVIFKLVFVVNDCWYPEDKLGLRTAWREEWRATTPDQEGDYGGLGFPDSLNAKNPPAMQETQDQSLGQEDPLEKGMATHSSILAWSITWIEEPGGLQSLELQGVEQD